MPYTLGGDIYPHLIHVGTHDNASDDVSRFVKLRQASEVQPPWLTELLKGDPRLFQLIRRADRFVWPLNGWARMFLLLSVHRGN